MTEKLTLVAKEVEWTNPLTGDGEFCTVGFECDPDGENIELKTVTWDRTGENCELRWIIAEVKAELIEGIETQISDGEFEEIKDADDSDAED